MVAGGCWTLGLAGLSALLLAWTGPASAQAPAPGCPGAVARLAPSILPAAAPLEPQEARLTFVGHATFLIESPGGVRIATDYNDYVRPDVTPDVATMNHAHSTHYTDRPDPGIRHVLRGWTSAPDGGRHDLTVGDARVRNVTTNIRDWGGGTERGGNSIFVFEMADLCIAHLGHLHHPLTPDHLRELGRIDVALVPVDGSWTLNLEGLDEVLAQLGAPLVVPMHYFNQGTLDRFIERARDRYEVRRGQSAEVILSRASLPARPTLLVLPGR